MPPVLDRNLERMAQRAMMGLAKTGVNRFQLVAEDYVNAFKATAEGFADTLFWPKSGTFWKKKKIFPKA